MRRFALYLVLLSGPAFAEPLPEPTPAAPAAPARLEPVPNLVLALPVVGSDPAATPEQRAAQAAVQTKLVTPLAQRESGRSRFSRVVMPAPLMRVRVTDPAAHSDAQGGAYMSFAVDSCRSFDPKDGCWQNATITGCVYPTSGQVFVQRGSQYFPADILLGKKANSAANVCQAPARS
jgi:hypothetical protein